MNNYDYSYSPLYLGPDVMFIRNTEISIINLEQNVKFAKYSVEDYIYVKLLLEDKFKNIL